MRRGRRSPSTSTTGPTRPPALLAVALGKAFASARRGGSKERPELVDVDLPAGVHVPALSCRGGPEMAYRFFTPLGWQVEAMAVPLDEMFRPFLHEGAPRRRPCRHDGTTSSTLPTQLRARLAPARPEPTSKTIRPRWCSAKSKTVWCSRPSSAS